MAADRAADTPRLQFRYFCWNRWNESGATAILCVQSN